MASHSASSSAVSEPSPCDPVPCKPISHEVKSVDIDLRFGITFDDILEKLDNMTEHDGAIVRYLTVSGLVATPSNSYEDSIWKPKNFTITHRKRLEYWISQAPVRSIKLNLKHLNADLGLPLIKAALDSDSTNKVEILFGHKGWQSLTKKGSILELLNQTRKAHEHKLQLCLNIPSSMAQYLPGMLMLVGSNKNLESCEIIVRKTPVQAFRILTQKDKSGNFEPSVDSFPVPDPDTLVKKIQKYSSESTEVKTWGYYSGIHSHIFMTIKK